MKVSLEELKRAERDQMSEYQLSWHKSGNSYSSDIYKSEGFMLNPIDKDLKVFLSVEKTTAEIKFVSKIGSFKFPIDIPCDDVEYAKSEALYIVNILFA